MCLDTQRKTVYHSPMKVVYITKICTITACIHVASFISASKTRRNVKNLTKRNKKRRIKYNIEVTLKLSRKECWIANNCNWKSLFMMSSCFIGASKHLETIKALGLRARAFICFSVFRYLDETLALVLYSSCKLRPNDRNIWTQRMQHCWAQFGHPLQRVATCSELKIELVRMPRVNIVAGTWPNDYNSMQHPQLLHEKIDYFQI